MVAESAAAEVEAEAEAAEAETAETAEAKPDAEAKGRVYDISDDVTRKSGEAVSVMVYAPHKNVVDFLG